MSLSEKIIEVAEERDITFAELAKIAGVDKATISRMVNCKHVGNKAISKLVNAFGKEFERYYQYAKCRKCGEMFIPWNAGTNICSSKCLRDKVFEDRISWKKYPGKGEPERQTNAQRFGWGAKVKGPATSIPEYNSIAREEYGSYGQRTAAERLAQSGTMRESMGL